MNKITVRLNLIKRHAARRHFVVVVAAVAAVFLLDSCKKRPTPPAAPTPEVVCITATKHEVTNSFEFIGQTVAEEFVNIVPMVEGYLVRQCFDEGSMVKKGDLLFEIDPRPFEAQVKNAQGQVAAAKAQMINANIEYERYTTLIKETATSQEKQDTATMKKGSAEGQLLIAEAALETAKINLEYTRLRAPFDGKIGVCPISVGNLVGPGANQKPLTSIMKMNPMKVEFNIPETAMVYATEKFGNLDNAAKLAVTRIRLPDGSLYPHDGAIYFINNQISSDTGTLTQRARFPNPDNILTPNEYVKISIVAKNKKSVIIIPQSAIVEDMTGSLVMVVRNGKVERHPVKIGQTHDNNIEIVSGISEGDQVITEGLLKVRQGMVVNVRPSAPNSVKAGEQAK